MKKLLCGLMALVCASFFAMPSVAQSGPSASCQAKDVAGNCIGAVSSVIRGAATDDGANIGTSAQVLIPANVWRRGFSVQNQSATADCYINGQTTATTDYHSLKVAAGVYYETPPTHVGTGAISIICTGASTSVYAREW